MLTDEMKQKLSEKYEDLRNTGKLPTRQQQDQYYASFRRRFGPDQLSKLDGERFLKPCTAAKTA